MFSITVVIVLVISGITDWLDGKLSTRAAIFRTEKTNERTTDSDFANNSFLLSGKRHSQGIELDVVGRLTPQWEVYASYSYIPKASIDAAVEECGGRVDALFSCAGVADGTPGIEKINFLGHRHMINRMLDAGMLGRGSAIGFISSAAICVATLGSLRSESTRSRIPPSTLIAGPLPFTAAASSVRP